MDTLLINGEPIPFAASPNNGPRPAGVEASLIVLHSTGGRYRGSVDWLRSPASNASAHVVVSREGG